MTQSLLDSYHRHIDYMRISVTDRCNLRCIYCNASTMEHLSHDDILRYEEIERVVRAAANLGVKASALPAASRPCARMWRSWSSSSAPSRASRTSP